VNWLATLIGLRRNNIAALMVTVVSVVGSTPRNPGARMIVTSKQLYGTIGGGNLEHQSCAIARDKLESGQAQQLRRFPLGAGLGQCCGGLVNLLFEPISENTQWLDEAMHLQSQQQNWIRLLPTTESADAESRPSCLLTLNNLKQQLSEHPAGDQILATALSLFESETQLAALTHCEQTGVEYYLELHRKPDFQLTLFGAGHVGQALVQILAELPVQVRWVDSREQQFPQKIPDNVEVICTDTPESEVDQAPAASFFLVMTHEHPLDQLLCEHIIKHDDFSYFGLIGSQSKRRMFETRMSRRGIAEEKIANMVCPIGIDGITSKLPAMIAISVAAEMMQVYDQLVSQIRYTKNKTNNKKQADKITGSTQEG
jgi:xanthine dehydrogenase accessory factor